MKIMKGVLTMEENRDNMDCPLCKHPIFKYILTGLLVFLGAFSAFYVVADMHMFRMMNDPAYGMRKMEKEFMKDRKRMEKMVQHGFEKDERIAKQGGEVFHITKTPDNYKIIIDLSAFDNDEKNVEVRTNDRVLTVIAAGMENTRRGTKIMKFSQSYMFGDNVDLNNLTKMHDGNNYIITIPIYD